VQIMRDLGDPVSAAQVIGSRYHGVEARRSGGIKNSRIVGRDDGPVNSGRGGGPLCHPDNQRFSGDQQQRLTRKTGRPVASRDHCDSDLLDI